jgi:lysine-N-methylase
MAMPIKTLPMVERWGCVGCGNCCRGSRIPLDDTDLQRLQAQRWQEHPDFRSARIVTRAGWLPGRYQLAQRDDGTCVFLTADRRCRIHQQFGFEAKPLVCRMYPLQLVPLEHATYLTLRRSCPSAAADEGRELTAYRDDAKRYAQLRPQLLQPGLPPVIVRGQRRSWADTRLVTGALEQLLNDQRFPLVRRLVHASRFCKLLEDCRIRQLDRGQFQELLAVLLAAAPQQVGELFRDRTPPGRAAGILFRQTVMEYLRLHPRYVVQESWRERARLAWSAMAFARGRGAVPQLHPTFPCATFSALEERVLGPLEPATWEPINTYFEAQATSTQYAVASRPGWPLVDSFRALALGYPVALWLLRYFAGETPPARATAIEIVTILDRGQGFGPLLGRAHRRRVRHLVDLQTLERLAVWYARP